MNFTSYQILKVVEVCLWEGGGEIMFRNVKEFGRPQGDRDRSRRWGWGVCLQVDEKIEIRLEAPDFSR